MIVENIATPVTMPQDSNTLRWY